MHAGAFYTDFIKHSVKANSRFYKVNVLNPSEYGLIYIDVRENTIENQQKKRIFILFKQVLSTKIQKN